MTSTAHHDQDQLHRLAWEALPWVLNGRATAEQQDLVEQHLPHCPLCQHEWAHQQQLQHAVQEAPLALPPVEVGLTHLLARIDLDELCEQPTPAATTMPAPPVRRTTSWWGSAVAATLLLPVLGLGLVNTPWQDTRASYHALSDSPKPGEQPDAAGKGTIRLVPDPDMRVGRWTELLRQEQLHIVAGPNTVGAYALASTGQRSVQDTLQSLRQHPEVRMAEPIQGQP